MDAYAVPKTEYRYRDLGRLTSWLRIATWVNVVFTTMFLVTAVASDISTMLAPATRHGPPMPPVTEVVLAVLYGVSTVAFLLMFFVWVYRAAANVHALGADITFSPGWAVGWFLIPIANLWMSFVVIEELWRGSKDARDWRSQMAPWLVIDWWGIPVAASLVALVLRFIVGGTVAGEIASLLVDVARLWVAYLFIAISRHICAMQQAQAVSAVLE